MNTELRAYSYPGLTKADFLTELALHAAQDRFIRGEYWNEGKGCAVGCSLHSISNRLRLGWVSKTDLSEHASYEVYLGIPQVLARIEDRIFEGLSWDDARRWPVCFAEAIPVGADLSGVWNVFAPWLLREVALPAAGNGKTVRRTIIGVAEGYETNWTAQTPASARKAVFDASADARAVAIAAAANARAVAIAAAAANARAAADAAGYAAAARAAVHAAVGHASVTAFAAALTVAEAAAAVGYAAAAAVDAASWAGTYAAAQHGAYLRVANKLCDLLAAAPVPTP